jgi:hypothetical protein
MHAGVGGGITPHPTTACIIIASGTGSCASTSLMVKVMVLILMLQ